MQQSHPATRRINLRVPLLAAAIVLLVLFHSSSAPQQLSTSFTSFRAGSCPVPWQPTPSGPFPDQRLECQLVPSNSSDFIIQLCSNTKACNQGYVQITALDANECARLETTVDPAPLNREQSTFVKTTLGPHTFAVLFDGALRYASETPVDYQGECVYRYPYNLNNGGAFQLKVILVYDEYRGLDARHQEEWQPILSLPLLATPFLSDPTISCPQRCQRYTALDYTPRVQAAQAVCSRNEPITGSWLPAYNASVALAAVIKQGEFPPYEWVPHHCRLEGTALDWTTKVRDRAMCFGRRQQVLLTGDSHLRWLYDGFVQKLMGSMHGKPGGEAVFGKAEEKDYRIGGMTVDYLTDPVLSILRDELITGKRYADTTHVVVTAVQWLMHQPYHEYREHIELLLRKIALFRDLPLFAPATPHPKPHFVWFNSPAWPHRSDESVQTHNDTRTNARLKQMNDFASRRFAEEGFGVVDSFAVSLPFCTGGESPDSAHFYSTPVMNVLERIVAHRLDLCN